MAAALKDRYTRAYIARLAQAVAKHDRAFDAASFERAVLSRGWKQLELKARMRRIAECLHAHIGGDYRRQITVLKRAAPEFHGGHDGFLAMFFPDFVEVYGLEDFDASIAALEHFTRFSSSEFAVRPFLIRYGERMLKVFERWRRHRNEHVRRLASEGLRPRLPWAMALPAFKRDPAPILPILESLLDDPSEVVRRSVANNLNDIAKDHPKIVLDLAEKHFGRSENTDRLLKHACRTLLKRGNTRALALFGHDHAAEVAVTAFKLGAGRIAIGQNLRLRFTLRAAAATRARIEYAIDFVKARGQTSRKVFKVAERDLPANEEIAFERTHRFRDFTTRTHYPGRHRITILVNGVARCDRTVALLAP